MSVEGIIAPAVRVTTLTENNHRDWSDHSTGILRKMWEQGVSARLIGERLGRSEGAVRNRARDIGLARRVKSGTTYNHLEAVRSIEYTENKMRSESRKALEAYTKAILDSGGGSWGGHLSSVQYNSCGTYR